MKDASASTHAVDIALTPTFSNAASHTDATGAVTSFAYVGPLAASSTQRTVPYQQIGRIFTADNAALPNLQYDYDALGRVKFVHDAVNLQVGDHTVGGGRDPWAFLIADGTRGERDDPLGNGYTVVYDVYGNPARTIDEIGRETDALFDSRKRHMARIGRRNFTTRSSAQAPRTDLSRATGSRHDIRRKSSTRRRSAPRC